MANFMDLPKAVREEIYRLNLIADEQPVTLEEYKKTCGYTKNRSYRSKAVECKTPHLFHVSKKIEREASQIYFRENTFAFSGPEELSWWRCYTWPRHLQQMSRMVLLRWCELTPAAANKAFRALWELPKLDFVAVVIDEKAELRRLLEFDRIIRCGGRSTIGPQINLQLLHLPGMQGFRSLRGIREMKFILSKGAIDSEDAKDSGSIPGGLLESIRHEILHTVPPVSKEMNPEMRPFRFLDLPAEIRNIIYEMLLLFPGATYPIAAKPVSVTSQYPFKSRAANAALTVPNSALDVLLVSRQIHDEAHGIFYKNDLVFPTPARFQIFMVSLGNKRIECLRSLTLFNEYGYLVDTTERRGEIRNIYPPHIIYDLDRRALEKTDKWGVAILLIRLLPNLRKLHFLYRSSSMRYHRHLTGRMPSDEDLCYEDTGFMFQMRNISDIRVRDLDLEIFSETCSSGQLTYMSSKKAALKHLNHGLQLAQKSIVIRALFSGHDWRTDEAWPVLEGSDCGFSKGCICGPDED